MNIPAQHGTFPAPQVSASASPGGMAGDMAAQLVSGALPSSAQLPTSVLGPSSAPVPSVLGALASDSGRSSVGQPEARRTGATPGVAPEIRIIKRYSNRKLYDTQSSRYVTLPQIADMVRSGSNLRIVDNRSGEDKTEVTFALIISEELRASPRGIPLNTLTALIAHPVQSGTQAREAELFGDQEMDSKYSELRTRFESWFEEVSRERSSQPETLGALEAQLRRLDDRLTELEKQLVRKED